MANLIVGGVTVPVDPDGCDEKLDELADQQRMQDGTMRKTVIARKRQVTITTRLMLDADASTLRTALNTNSLPAACSGDLLGGSANWFPVLTGYKAVFAAGALRRRVSFTLYEA